MHTIRVVTDVAASPERCFDLARDIGAHVRSAAGTRERVVAGRTDGLLELGETVTFEARHLGVTQRLTSRMEILDRPHFFQDRMVRGAFRSFEHDHHFDPLPGGGTRMTDVVRFETPLRLLLWPVGRWIVRPHLRRFLIHRANELKAMAESGTTCEILAVE